jgi:aromatic-L-amino-acid decarboxylase
MPDPADRNPPPAERTLEPSADEMRRLVEHAMERIVAHVTSLGEQPMTYDRPPAEIARERVEPLPETGRPLDELLDLLFDEALPASFNAAAPGYLGFVPGGGIFAAAVGDLIAAATNRFTGVLAAAPALVQLEANVLRWFAEELGFPPEARGIFTSGGSLAAFSAVVTARRERLRADFLSGTIYVSDQAHHSLAKAAVLAGFPEANVRVVPSDGAFRIRPARLREMIAEDRRRGLDPFLVVGNAGTVNTGAVDPLNELADLAADEELWLHVDGAYGACFMLTDAGRRTLSGLERADSVVLDPHKGLFIPYGTGALLVRDGAALRRAHTFGADYLPELQEDSDLIDFHLYSPELSRHYRGLRVWLPLSLYGFGPFRRALEEKLELARWVAGELRSIEHVRVVADPELSLLAFRVESPEAPEAGPEAADRLDRLNRAVIERVNRRRRTFLTGTRVGGRFVIRICVLSVRTHRETLEAALEDVRAAVAEAIVEQTAAC